MKILITGVSGRIGHALLGYFEGLENSQLYFVVKERKESLSQYEQIIWDLNEKSDFDFFGLYFDRVIHMAAIAHHSGAKSVLEVNQAMTTNLLNAVKGKFDQFVFFSSISVYGEANRKYPVEVNDACDPTSFYGMSKLKSELFLKEHIENLLILRLCPMIDGEGRIDLEKRIFLPKTKTKFKSPYPRSYSFSTIDSIWRSLNDYSFKAQKRGVFNLSDGKIYSEQELLKMSSGEKMVSLPKILIAPLFVITGLFRSLSTVKNIENTLWKLFKVNTYS